MRPSVADMSGYEVEPAELFASGAQVRQAASDGRGRLDRLRAEVDELLGHGWRGTAATAFGTGWREWETGARTMLAALDEMAGALDASGRDYERNERAAAEQFRTVA